MPPASTSRAIVGGQRIAAASGVVADGPLDHRQLGGAANSTAAQASASGSAGNRFLDPTAVNLIAVSGKVLQVANGEIPLPEVVELWPTNFCGFACPHCRCAQYHGGTREAMVMPLFEQLLEQLSARGVKRLELSGGGEPLQHPVAREMLKRLCAGGFRVGLITNGHALVQDSGISDLLLECCDWVRISLDAISKETFCAVHGRPDLDFDLMRSAIHAFASRVRARSGPDPRPHIGLKFLIQETNRREMPRAIDAARAMGAHYVQFKYLENHPRSLSDGRAELTARLFEQAQALPPGTLDVDVLPGYGSEQYPGRCVMSVLHPMIDWDGEIYLCAFFNHRRAAHSIGNLSRQPFFDCWGSATHRARLAAVDPRQCVPNCPLKRYNPVVDFIVRESFRFHYI